ncbi:hypothetical protein [Burkholderia cepacia]|uniref:hypothetical protein n=1 Tax=Burkholderia cepacia TaxID=292 RepID=UPI0007C85BE7|nr:hypothetical protein [Burkholderia cepacia]
MPSRTQQPLIAANAMTIRRIAPAELAASRMWIENWQRMFPCLVATRGLLSEPLLDDITRFVAHPQPLLAIERALSTGDAMLVRASVFGLLHTGRIRAPALHVKVRMQAIERDALDDAVRDIEVATGVNRRQLYRLSKCAPVPHPEGRIYGYRALVATCASRSMCACSRLRSGARAGAAAWWARCRSCWSVIRRSPGLRLQLKQRRVTLEQRPVEGELRTRLRGLNALHAAILQQCQEVGFTAADNPFNTAGHAIRSLSARVKTELLRGFGTAARAAGAIHLGGLPHLDEAAAPVARRPYQVVEFDGHRLDFRLKVVVHDPLGFEHEFEIERVWLLVIVDVCTRVVFGNHVILAREYSRSDVIKTIEQAL